jgi:hypothetical protein
MLQARSTFDKKRRRKAISLAIFWDWIAIVLIGFMVMKKEASAVHPEGTWRRRTGT